MLKKLGFAVLLMFASTAYASNDALEINATEKVSNTPVFEVKQNYPNPFSKSTQISFVSTQDNQPYQIKIFDMLGHQVFNKMQLAEKGLNTVVFERGNLTEGIYFYSIEVNDVVYTKKMNIKD